MFNKGNSLKEKLSKWWKKAPREWLAVAAVVVLVGIGVLANITSNSSQFKGQFVPLDQFQTIDQNLNLSGQICIEGHARDANGNCTTKCDTAAGYVSAGKTIINGVEQDDCKLKCADAGHFPDPRAEWKCVKDTEEQCNKFANEGLSWDGKNCVSAEKACATRGDGYEWTGARCICHANSVNTPEGCKLAAPKSETDQDKVKKAKVKFCGNQQYDEATNACTGKGASDPYCRSHGLIYDRNQFKCIDAPTPKVSDTCRTFLGKLQELDRLFNQAVEKNDKYKTLDSAKVAEAKKEIQFNLNAIAFTMTQFGDNNCSTPPDDEFARAICESSDYSAHVAYEFERDYFNDIGYARADFNCSESFSSNIDVAKSIYNYKDGAKPSAPGGVASICGPGETYDLSTGRCELPTLKPIDVKCADGQVKDANGNCIYVLNPPIGPVDVICKAGEVKNIATGKCEPIIIGGRSCESYEEPLGTVPGCIHRCGIGTDEIWDGSKCVACPSGQKRVDLDDRFGNTCAPTSPVICESFQKSSGGKCVHQCAENQIYENGSCKPCKSTEYRVGDDKNACLPNVSGIKVQAPDILFPKSTDVMDNGRTDRTDPIEWPFRWRLKDDVGVSQVQIKISAPAAIASTFNVDQALDANLYRGGQFTQKYLNTFISDQYRSGWKWSVRANYPQKGGWTDWAESAFTVEAVNTDGGGSVNDEYRVLLSSPANSSVLTAGDTWNFKWFASKRIPGDANVSISKYRFIMNDGSGNSVVDTETTSSSWSGIIDTTKYKTTNSWTWKVGALQSNGRWVWSDEWSFGLVYKVDPGTQSMGILLDLEKDTGGRINARVRVKNNTSSTYSSNNVIFRVENLTDRLDPADYAYDYRGNPVFSISNLKSGDTSGEFVLYNLPNTSARGTKLFRVTLIDGNKQLGSADESISYDGKYDPYYPRPDGDKYAPRGRRVEIRGIVREYRGDYLLTDESDRLIAYLVSGNNGPSLRRYENDPVEVDAYIDFYSCGGSTLEVRDIRVLSDREPISNSFDDLFRAGAICYRDVDTRPVYDRANDTIIIEIGEEDPWWLPFAIDMFQKGIMKGDRDGVFHPGRNITIAETVKMAIMSARIQVRDEIFCIENGEPWYCNVMGVAADRGWLPRAAIRNPGQNATRAEVVEMVLRAFDIKPDYRSKTFPDVDYRDPNAGYIEAARRAGVIDGYPDGTFKPGQEINRAEVSKIYSNAIRIFDRAR